jgi:hypothetical protein
MVPPLALAFEAAAITYPAVAVWCDLGMAWAALIPGDSANNPVGY